MKITMKFEGSKVFDMIKEEAVLAQLRGAPFIISRRAVRFQRDSLELVVTTNCKRTVMSFGGPTINLRDLEPPPGLLLKDSSITSIRV